VTAPVHIRSVATALPPHQVGQDDAIGLARSLFSASPTAAFERMVPMFANVEVASRHVCELCSLTFRRRDASVANVISLALFGDGVAAAVLVAGDHDGPTVLGHDAVTWPGTEHLMGWHFGDDGLTVELAKSIPALVRREFATSVDDACDRLGIVRTDIDHHLVHPGSAVVLDAVEEALGLDADALDVSRRVLADHGNMSAATILYILDRFVGSGTAVAGETAMVSAMGPGFSAEHVVLRW